MKRAIALVGTTLVCLVLSPPAQAHRHHHRGHYARHYHGHNVARSRTDHGIYQCAGCVLRDTLAGVVAVSAANAERFVGLIDDLVHAGFRGEVHCAAPYGTHIRNSKHHDGNACDFAQSGWGRTVPIMYHQEAAAIIKKYGFTNGCSFRDCGHVGLDGQGHVASRHHHVRYAAYHHYYRRHYAGA